MICECDAESRGATRLDSVGAPHPHLALRSTPSSLAIRHTIATLSTPATRPSPTTTLRSPSTSHPYPNAHANPIHPRRGGKREDFQESTSIPGPKPKENKTKTKTKREMNRGTHRARIFPCRPLVERPLLLSLLALAGRGTSVTAAYGAVRREVVAAGGRNGTGPYVRRACGWPPHPLYPDVNANSRRRFEQRRHPRARCIAAAAEAEYGHSREGVDVVVIEIIVVWIEVSRQRAQSLGHPLKIGQRAATACSQRHSLWRGG
jgi:hypothetical protein